MKYRLGGIGWYNFETLVQTLLKAVIGPGVTSFGGTKDNGRDATFVGTADFPSKAVKWKGYWIFQVKYTDVEEQGVTVSRKALRRTLVAEIKNILGKTEPRRRLVGVGARPHKARRGRLPDNYVLITNVPLTAKYRDALDAAVKKEKLTKNFRCIDGREACEFLDLFPDVRRSYPQLLGLADLDLIVNRDLYARSEAFLQQWQKQLGAFVATEAYRQALRTVKRTNFVVLDGPPESGKTTIAAAIALLHGTQGFEVIDVKSPDEVFRAHKPNKKQLFVADDAVGSISFDPSLSDSWSRGLGAVLRKLKANHILVWTTRSYVLEEALAKSKLKEVVEGFPEPHEVLVEVGDLTEFEKAAILYNHAKLAKLPKKAKDFLRKEAVKIIAHPNFTPEKVRQLVANVLPSVFKGQRPSTEKGRWKAVSGFLDNPSERWIRAYNSLGLPERTLLTALLDFESKAAYDALKRAYEARCEALSIRPLRYDACVGRLEHSFIRTGKLYRVSGDRVVDFQHPSLRDILLSELRDDSAARLQYIQLATPLGLANALRGMCLEDEASHKEHVVLPRTKKELETLARRLRNLSLASLPYDEWRALLSNAQMLVPRDPQDNKLEPSRIDMGTFQKSDKGAVLRSVLDAFGDASTYENNKRYHLSCWFDLLEQFQELASYVAPPSRVMFLAQLASDLGPEVEAEVGIRFANILSQLDPLLLRQCVERRAIKNYDVYLKERASELVLTGEDAPLDYDHSPDSFDEWWGESGYDEWFGDSESVISLAQTFYRWSGYSAPADVETLEGLLMTVAPPPEPDYDDYEDLSLGDASIWTIDMLFEDL